MNGHELSELGGKRALRGAEAEHPDWGERALGFVKEYATKRRQFSAEELRAWAHKNGLPIPAEPRAWGQVMRRAAKQNIVEHTGWTTSGNPSRHSGIISIWRVL